MTLTLPAPRRAARTDYIVALLVGVVLTGLSYEVALQANWISGLHWLEVFAVFTSYVCTYLCVVERRINYPIGVISSVAYCVLFYQDGLNASAILNGWLAIQLFYGWFRWRSDENTRPVTFVGMKWWPVYIVATGAFYGLAVLAENLVGGSSFVWTDAFILIGSILAQWLLDNKKLENWVVWLTVDIVATWEYFSGGLYLAGFQYVFFLANTFYGFYVWERSRRNAKKSVRVDDSFAADEGAPALS